MGVFDTHAHYDSGAFNQDRFKGLDGEAVQGGGSVEHHRVVLRDMFTREEALKLKETEQYEKDKHLRQAVDYVLDRVAIK